MSTLAIKRLLRYQQIEAASNCFPLGFKRSELQSPASWEADAKLRAKLQDVPLLAAAKLQFQTQVQGALLGLTFLLVVYGVALLLLSLQYFWAVTLMLIPFVAGVVSKDYCEDVRAQGLDTWVHNFETSNMEKGQS